MKNLKYEYDFDTFKNIKEFDRLKLLLGENTQDSILRHIEKIEEYSTPSREDGVYSTSDVFGPINLNEAGNIDIAI